MQEQYNEGKTFTNIILTDARFDAREFEDCTFVDCDFSNSQFLDSKFIDCKFSGCNLSMVKMKGTIVTDLSFSDCKLLGVNFSDCEDFAFGVEFDKCVLDYCSFMGKKMAKTKFKDSSIQNAIFSDANLSQAVFERTDLFGTVFSQTILKQADFSTAFNFSIDPAFNTLNKAKFSIYGLPGLLDKYDIKVQE